MTKYDEQPHNDEQHQPHQHGHNTRNRRISYGFRFENQMHKSNHPQSYETQLIQNHTISELTPVNEDNNDLFTDYTVDDIREAIHDADNDPKDALKFIVYYMFTQLGTTDESSSFEQMSAKKGIKNLDNKLSMHYLLNLHK